MRITLKFNMVEIALAIVIIAIGLSSVLVLFPIGINATRAAMDENNYSDAAEYISSYVRGQFLNQWRQDYENNHADIKAGTKTFTTSFDDKNFFKTSYPNPPGTGFTWGNVLGNYPELRKAKESDGVYQFVRTGPEGEEIFSAEIKVWRISNDLIQNPDSTVRSRCPLYIPNGASSFNPALNISFPAGTLPEMIQSVLVEISWPITSEPEDRTVRTFRLDVNNPYYFPRST